MNYSHFLSLRLYSIGENILQILWGRGTHQTELSQHNWVWQTKQPLVNPGRMWLLHWILHSKKTSHIVYEAMLSLRQNFSTSCSGDWFRQGPHLLLALTHDSPPSHLVLKCVFPAIRLLWWHLRQSPELCRTQDVQPTSSQVPSLTLTVKSL